MYTGQKARRHSKDCCSCKDNILSDLESEVQASGCVWQLFHFLRVRCRRRRRRWEKRRRGKKKEEEEEEEEEKQKSCCR